MFDQQNLFFMKLIYTALILLFSFTAIKAQTVEKQFNTFSFSPAFELLRSTHSNLFYSPSIKVNYLYKNGFEPGLGIEYSATPIHHDNGYVLYKLRYLPIYGNLKYNFSPTKKLQPYVETSLGLSIIKYSIAADPTPNSTSVVKEQGFYVYGGTGLRYPITKNIKGFVGIGFKGYRMSTNDLDINPHGLSFQAGFSIL